LIRNESQIALEITAASDDNCHLYVCDRTPSNSKQIAKAQQPLKSLNPKKQKTLPVKMEKSGQKFANHAF